MPQAFLLIHSVPNKTLELCKLLKSVKGVTETYTLFNEGDLLAKLEWGKDEPADEGLIDTISRLEGIITIQALRIRDYAK